MCQLVQQGSTVFRLIDKILLFKIFLQIRYALLNPCISLLSMEDIVLIVWILWFDFVVLIFFWRWERGSFGITPQSERRFDLNRPSYFIFDRASATVIYLFICLFIPNNYSVIFWTGHWASYQVPWPYPSLWYTQNWCNLCWAWATW